MKERFVVNEHLDVVLEDDGKTHVYIDGKRFIQCMRLVLTIPLSDEVASVASIDDAREVYGTVYEGRGYESIVHHISIDPAVEFMGHCSNIQSWAEHDYDTRLLHSNIAFPLLKVLAKAGDAKATKVLFAEVATRFRDGSRVTRTAILETCADMLDERLIREHVDGMNHYDPVLFHDELGSLATRLHLAGNETGEIAVYQKAIEIDPTYYRHYEHLGDALKAKGDVAGAIDVYRKATALDPRLGIVWNKLGLALAESGDIAGAIDAYRNAIAVEPMFPSTWYNLGLVLEKTGDAAGAIDAYRKTIELDPENVDVLNSLWNTWHNAKGVERRPGREDVIDFFFDKFIRLGRVLFAKGDVKRAITAYSRATEIDPGNTFVWTRLGDAFMAAGDAARASNAYGRATENDPGKGSLWWHLGKTLEVKGDLDGAISAYRKHIEIAPGNKYAWNRLGNALESKGDLNGANDAHRKATEIAPRDASTWERLGSFLKQTGDVDGAIDAYRKAIESAPFQGWRWVDLGGMLEIKGDVNGAIAAYRKAIDEEPYLCGIDSHDGYTWNRLGRALKKAGDVDGANGAHRKATEIAPEEAEGWNLLSCVYTEGGTLKEGIPVDQQGRILVEAKDAANKAISLAPRVGLYHTTLGEALQASGNIKGAIREYQRALELDPGEKYAMDYLQRFGVPIKCGRFAVRRTT